MVNHGYRAPILPSMKHLFLAFWSLLATWQATAQHSLVRVWNDQTLKAIRNDLARPPVHARNLFHVNAAMYDAWAAYVPSAQPWMLGRTNGNYTCPFPALTTPSDRSAAQKEAMSFATYRLLRHRFLNSPGFEVTSARLNHLMDSLGYDRTFTGMDPSTGGPAALGNYIAHHYIMFGLQDGSNENGNYANQYYTPANASLQMILPGNPAMADPNRWQPITLPTSIDQAGNPVSSTPPFVGAEWGNVHPFSLSAAQSTTYTRDGHSWKVYLDPGGPAQLDPASNEGLESFFKWNHAMVSIWQSHLDPAQDVTWDISPGSIGNSSNYPTTPAEYAAFYDLLNGGDNSPGHSLNPVTGQPYAPNLVDRGNYTRVLAEFWADGVDSETPPGHWFEILHNVMDLPGFHRRWLGAGPELDTLEYDVKAHFALGSAMHDAAITAWGIKGYYDSVRPVSAIRFMGDRGQCSDPQGPRYDPAGMPIIAGFIEQVMPGDPLEGPGQEDLYKIKLYTYRGPSYVTDPGSDVAGVGWILAEDWWPYQRPTFVTPPFAGFISGHSTYSRTAAEVLTAITGSPYFPGGMIEYVIPQNEFLVFEDGPDEEVRLQWATYRDASDACSLSRIWGGIHPAMDDIPGRTIGMQLGPQVVGLADQYFNEGPPRVVGTAMSHDVLGPVQSGSLFTMVFQFDRAMDPTSTLVVSFPSDDPMATPSFAPFTQTWTAPDRLEISTTLLNGQHDLRDIDLIVSGAKDPQGRTMAPYAQADAFIIDTRFPEVLAITTEQPIYTRNDIGPASVRVHVTFDEAGDPSTQPTITFTASSDPTALLVLQEEESSWINDQEYVAVFALLDGTSEIPAITVAAVGSSDAVGNIQLPFTAEAVFAIDLKAPTTLTLEATDAFLTMEDVGSLAQQLSLTFDEAMDQTIAPLVIFSGADPLDGSLTRVALMSYWNDDHTCQITYSLSGNEVELLGLDISVEGLKDIAGNSVVPDLWEDVFSIDTRKPTVTSAVPATTVINDASADADQWAVQLSFSESMDTSVLPFIAPTQPDALSGSLIYSPNESSWIDPTTFRAAFEVTDLEVEVDGVDIGISLARDVHGNRITAGTLSGLSILVDTRNPRLLSATADPAVITDAHVGPEGLVMTTTFDEVMDADMPPHIVFDGTLSGSLIFDPALSAWSSGSTHEAVHGVQASIVDVNGVDVEVSQARDLAGNPMVIRTIPDVMDVTLTGVGIHEVSADGPLVLSPNPVPSGGSIRVMTTDALNDHRILILDAAGRTVLNVPSVPTLNGTLELALPSLAAGAYELVLLSGEHRQTGRIIILAP